MKTAEEIIKNLKPDKKAHNRTEYLLSIYKDLKDGSQLIEAPRSVTDIIDDAVNMIKDDPYIDLIKYLYYDGLTVEKISEITNLDERTIYRHKKRLIRRIALILYGDEALKE